MDKEKKTMPASLLHMCVMMKVYAWLNKKIAPIISALKCYVKAELKAIWINIDDIHRYT